MRNVTQTQKPTLPPLQIYIFIAIGYEERDMIAVFGDKYRAYMAKTPVILPFGGRNLKLSSRIEYMIAVRAMCVVHVVYIESNA